jgi:hypothetical protein
MNLNCPASQSCYYIALRLLNTQCSQEHFTRQDLIHVLFLRQEILSKHKKTLCPRTVIRILAYPSLNEMGKVRNRVRKSKKRSKKEESPISYESPKEHTNFSESVNYYQKLHPLDKGDKVSIVILISISNCD